MVSSAAQRDPRRVFRQLLSRRQFFGALAAGGWAAWSGCSSDSPRQPVPGRIVNEGSPRGHLLRDVHSWADFTPTDHACDVAIVGGGISGLAAAWKLRQSGVERILLLDLEDQLGGTSRSGQWGDQVFPWGAHYINIPPAEADCIHEILQDLGVIDGYDAANRPMVAAGAMLRWPHERLFYRGRWTDGLDPFIDASDREREVLLRFEDEMLGWALHRGRDGRRAFAMPLRYSTADSRVRRLDQISMAQYLREEGWHDERLGWLVDYACRDDYGSTAAQVSAWAGIHYYACRFYDYRIEEAYPAHTLTWPEGNGHLVQQLANRLGENEIKRQALVARLAEERGQVRLGYIDLATGEKRQLAAQAVVYAGKLHTAPYAIADLPDAQAEAMAAIEYSPWLVAAIFLKEPLAAHHSTWDNVLYDSPSLGYVVADHQQGGGRVLLYYWPFVDQLAEARQTLLAQDHSFWTEQIMADLRRVHPEIDDLVERVNLYRWGHGMMRPSPGSLWGPMAGWRQQPMERIFFASCDATGLPLCEEAIFAGMLAAEQAMDCLGVAYSSSLGGLADA